MKRYLLLGLLSVVMAGTAHALPEDLITTDNIVSTAATSVVAGSACADVGKRIYGYDFTDSSAGYVGIYDAGVVAARAGTGEFSITNVAANEVSQVRLPLPRLLVTGFSALFKNSTGSLVVYCR